MYFGTTHTEFIQCLQHSVAKMFPRNIRNICAEVIPNRKPLLPLCLVAVSDMEQVFSNNIDISSFPGASDIWFSLKGTTYQNNSIVILEDIGRGDDDALLCITNQTACSQSNDTGGPALGNWFFPNGTRVPSDNANRTQWDFYRTRGQMVVRMHHKRGGVEGIYRCEIPDAMNVTQTKYIGVYSATTGEWWLYVHPCSAL